MRGRDKLMEDIGGQPLLRRQTKSALATGCPVMVCLPPTPGLRHNAVADLNVTQLLIKDAAEGLGATLRTATLFAARHAPDRPMMILLPDVPGITAFDIKTILTAFDRAGGDTPTRATDDTGKPGTPLVLPPRLLVPFTKLADDYGGRHILDGETVQNVPFTDNRATRDLDTPEDWTEWRKDNPTPT